MNAISLPERHLVAMPPSTPSPAVQQIWFAAQRRPWFTLAVVAPDARDDVHALAAALVMVGRLTNTGEVDLLNAQGTGLGEVARHLESMSLAPSCGCRLVVATDPVISSPASLPLLRAADAVVLVLSLSRSHLAAAARTLDLIGRERVLGCALFNSGVVHD